MPSDNNGKHGRRAEEAIARGMRRAGCDGVELSPGSRGPADIVAASCPAFPEGLAVQVKSTRRPGKNCKPLTGREWRALVGFGRARRVTVVEACRLSNGATRFGRLRRPR